MKLDLFARLPSNINIFGLHITFYALFILTGAIIALFLGSFEARKRGYSWDFFSTIFIIAFPMGIVGARIWYVIAEWNAGGFANDFAQIFRIWDGGLAIQGGAILGIIAGAIVVFTRRKGTNLLMVLDIAIPGILVAQAVGRWGNFFNYEVYGLEVARTAWNFLPNFILNQMQVDVNNPALINSPLFLTEGIINLIGYFAIAHFIVPLFKQHKIYAFGDASGLYFVWYGIARAILEPMRSSDFIMGTQTQASSVMAYVFIGLGLIFILLVHLIPMVFKKEKAGRLS